MKTTILTIAAMATVSIAVQGAWVEGDPHKMHFPQRTSLDPFNDVAVCRFGGGPWEPIVEPFGGPGFKMAFVITPEPGTTVLALLGVGFLLRRRR